MQLASLSLIFFLALASLHDVYIGLTNIDINEGDNLIEVSFKLDKQNLEYAFLHNYLYRINFNEDNLNEKGARFVQDYVNKNFQVVLNDQAVVLELYKHETSEQEVWLYFNQKINIEIDSILVRNLLLLDVNLNQKNLVFVKTSNLLKGFILDKDENRINLNLIAKER